MASITLENGLLAAIVKPSLKPLAFNGLASCHVAQQVQEKSKSPSRAAEEMRDSVSQKNKCRGNGASPVPLSLRAMTMTYYSALSLIHLHY